MKKYACGLWLEEMDELRKKVADWVDKKILGKLDEQTTKKKNIK